MILFPKDICKMLDVSVLRTDVTVQEVQNLIKIIREKRFLCGFVMPCYTELLINAFKDDPDILVGGVVGFPTGTDLTEWKVQHVKDYKILGCDEVDMVINVGKLKSGMYKEVEDDVKAVAEAAEETPLKVILEVTLLTDDEIRRGCEIVARSGAAFVKTGTGWAKNPTTLHHIRVMKDTVGDSIKIKAAGGVKTLDVLLDMYKLGATRFGVGLESALSIINEANKYKDGIIIE